MVCVTACMPLTFAMWHFLYFILFELRVVLACSAKGGAAVALREDLHGHGGDCAIMP